MQLEPFIKQLMQEFELEGSLATQVPGNYALPLEPDVSVQISETPEGFTLFSTLCPCPKERQEEFFTQMLLGNLFGQGTEGAVLGLDEEGKHLTLSRVITEQVEYPLFMDILEDFMNSVDFWRTEAADHIKGVKT